MADLLCGLSVDTKALDAAIGNIKAELNSLTSGAGGIADQIGTMKADLQAKADLALADLNKLIPDIKPELPNLQAEMSSLLAQISNPVNFSTALADIRTKFGNIPGVDIDSLVSELKSNPLNFDICSING